MTLASHEALLALLSINIEISAELESACTALGQWGEVGLLGDGRVFRSVLARSERASEGDSVNNLGYS